MLKHDHVQFLWASFVKKCITAREIIILSENMDSKRKFKNQTVSFKFLFWYCVAA